VREKASGNCRARKKRDLTDTPIKTLLEIHMSSTDTKVTNFCSVSVISNAAPVARRTPRQRTKGFQ